MLNPAILRGGSDSVVRGLGPAARFRYGRGITVTGSGVSQWDDASGNGRHLKQATDANRPAKQADGSILFDGVGHYLKCDAFTLNQPLTHYLLFKQVTWTLNDWIIDGNTQGVAGIRQNDTTPELQLITTAGIQTADLAVDTYGVVAAVLNGASSALQVNNGTATTGDAGAGNPAGLTLGATGGTAINFAHVQVKEVIVYAAAHDAATRANVIRYLMKVGGL